MNTGEYSRISVEKPVSTDPLDDESVSSEQDGLVSGFRRPASKLWTRALMKKGLLATAAAILMGSYVGVFFVGRHSFSEKEIDQMCLYQSSPYSPILKHMDPTPKLTQFNGTLGYPSEYTGDPSPEVDAAWDKWGYVKYASIPEEEFNKLPGSPEHFENAARLTPEYGGGYIGFLEFSHHMHVSEGP